MRHGRVLPQPWQRCPVHGVRRVANSPGLAGGYSGTGCASERVERSINTTGTSLVQH